MSAIALNGPIESSLRHLAVVDAVRVTPRLRSLDEGLASLARRQDNEDLMNFAREIAAWLSAQESPRSGLN